MKLIFAGNGGKSQGLTPALSAVQVALGDIQIGLISRLGERLVFLLLFLGFGFAAPGVLRAAHEPLQMPHIVLVLPPIAYLLDLAPPSRERDDLAHRVIQQVDIRRVMHMGLNHKGIAPPMQRFVVFFF